MKKSIILFLFIFAAFSCSDFLDDPQPSQSLPALTAFSKLADIETGLVGAYNFLQASDLGGTNFTMVPDVISDNGLWRGSFPSYRDIFNHQMTPDNAEVSGMWTGGYRAINAANLILKALTTVDDPALTADIANRIEGEALFIRGMVHFEMVRFFGKPYGASPGTDLGIPIMTSAVETTEDITFPNRNTVAEVYAQAEADLTAAAGKLAGYSERGRASTDAANCYLAEIAFQKEDYAAAASFAANVISTGNYALTADPVDFFVSEGSSEEIFAVIHTEQDNPGVNGSLPTFHNVAGRGGDVVFQPDLLDNGFGSVFSADQLSAIDAEGATPADMRLIQLSFDGNGTQFIEKYEDPLNNADDAPIWRLAEVLLLRAEALARTEGVNDASVNMLNMVRTRALKALDANDLPVANSDDLVSYSTSDFASADDLIEVIINERRVEMAFEGQRFHDLSRLKRTVNGDAWDANNLRFPIPQNALDANGNLVQNPGY